MYPQISDRVKAAIIDGVILIFLMYLASLLFSAIGDENINLKIAVFIFISFLYDPLLTAFVGGTLGHHFVGIRVKCQSDESKNIILPLAILRFILKASLG